MMTTLPQFMAWERSFEKRVLAIRDKELRYQRLNYLIETLWNAIWYEINFFSLYEPFNYPP